MRGAISKKKQVPAGKVKITMNLRAPLVKRAKIAAIGRALTFSALVEQGLREVLTR